MLQYYLPTYPLLPLFFHIEGSSAQASEVLVTMTCYEGSCMLDRITSHANICGSHSTYHVEYMIADKLGAGVNVEKVRVGQGRWPNERHGQFSVGVNFQSTELVFRMLHGEWRETKQQLN